MARAADVAEFRQAQKDIVTLAIRDLMAFWRTLDPSDAVGTVRALEAFLPELIQAYGEIGATVAADFYENLREQSPSIRAAYNAVLGDAIPIDQIQASTRWAAGPLFTPTADFAALTLGRVIDITDRLIKAQGRQTIGENVARDPARVRYARVPTGPTTCAFCLMLASRGPVYDSAATAGGHYHGHCDCVPTPVWEGDSLPEGYDLGGLQKIYRQAISQAGSRQAKGSDGVLAAIRREQGVS